jgi:hypothetical protein
MTGVGSDALIADYSSYRFSSFRPELSQELLSSLRSPRSEDTRTSRKSATSIP